MEHRKPQQVPGTGEGPAPLASGDVEEGNNDSGPQVLGQPVSLPSNALVLGVPTSRPSISLGWETRDLL